MAFSVSGGVLTITGSENCTSLLNYFRTNYSSSVLDEPGSSSDQTADASSINTDLHFVIASGATLTIGDIPLLIRQYTTTQYDNSGNNFFFQALGSFAVHSNKFPLYLIRSGYAAHGANVQNTGLLNFGGGNGTTADQSLENIRVIGAGPNGGTRQAATFGIGRNVTSPIVSIKNSSFTSLGTRATSLGSSQVFRCSDYDYRFERCFFSTTVAAGQIMLLQGGAVTLTDCQAVDTVVSIGALGAGTASNFYLLDIDLNRVNLSSTTGSLVIVGSQPSAGRRGSVGLMLLRNRTSRTLAHLLPSYDATFVSDQIPTFESRTGTLMIGNKVTLNVLDSRDQTGVQDFVFKGEDTLDDDTVNDSVVGDNCNISSNTRSSGNNNSALIHDWSTAKEYGGTSDSNGKIIVKNQTNPNMKGISVNADAVVKEVWNAAYSNTSASSPTAVNYNNRLPIELVGKKWGFQDISFNITDTSFSDEMNATLTAFVDPLVYATSDRTQAANSSKQSATSLTDFYNVVRAAEFAEEIREQGQLMELSGTRILLRQSGLNINRGSSSGFFQSVRSSVADDDGSTDMPLRVAQSETESFENDGLFLGFNPIATGGVTLDFNSGVIPFNIDGDGETLMLDGLRTASSGTAIQEGVIIRNACLMVDNDTTYRIDGDISGAEFCRVMDSGTGTAEDWVEGNVYAQGAEVQRGGRRYTADRAALSRQNTTILGTDPLLNNIQMQTNAWTISDVSLEWNTFAIYNTGDVVKRGFAIYRSKTDNNVGNSPAETLEDRSALPYTFDTTNWERIAPFSGDVTSSANPAAFIFEVGDSVAAFDGVIKLFTNKLLGRPGDANSGWTDVGAASSYSGITINAGANAAFPDTIPSGITIKQGRTIKINGVSSALSTSNIYMEVAGEEVSDYTQSIVEGALEISTSITPGQIVKGALQAEGNYLVFFELDANTAEQTYNLESIDPSVIDFTLPGSDFSSNYNAIKTALQDTDNTTITGDDSSATIKTLIPDDEFSPTTEVRLKSFEGTRLLYDLMGTNKYLKWQTLIGGRAITFISNSTAQINDVANTSGDYAKMEISFEMDQETQTFIEVFIQNTSANYEVITDADNINRRLIFMAFPNVSVNNIVSGGGGGGGGAGLTNQQATELSNAARDAGRMVGLLNSDYSAFTTTAFGNLPATGLTTDQATQLSTLFGLVDNAGSAFTAAALANAPASGLTTSQITQINTIETGINHLTGLLVPNNTAFTADALSFAPAGGLTTDERRWLSTLFGLVDSDISTIKFTANAFLNAPMGLTNEQIVALNSARQDARRLASLLTTDLTGFTAAALANAPLGTGGLTADQATQLSTLFGLVDSDISTIKFTANAFLNAPDTELSDEQNTLLANAEQFSRRVANLLTTDFSAFTTAALANAPTGGLTDDQNTRLINIQTNADRLTGLLTSDFSAFTTAALANAPGGLTPEQLTTLNSINTNTAHLPNLLTDDNLSFTATALQNAPSTGLTNSQSIQLNNIESFSNTYLSLLTDNRDAFKAAALVNVPMSSGGGGGAVSGGGITAEQARRIDSIYSYTRSILSKIRKVQ